MAFHSSQRSFHPDGPLCFSSRLVLALLVGPDFWWRRPDDDDDDGGGGVKLVSARDEAAEFNPLKSIGFSHPFRLNCCLSRSVTFRGPSWWPPQPARATLPTSNLPSVRRHTHTNSICSGRLCPARRAAFASQTKPKSQSKTQKLLAAKSRRFARPTLDWSASLERREASGRQMKMRRTARRTDGRRANQANCRPARPDMDLAECLDFLPRAGSGAGQPRIPREARRFTWGQREGRPQRQSWPSWPRQPGR